MRRIAFSLIIASSFVLAACGQKNLTVSSFDGSQSVTVAVEIADSPKEREKGLMERASLPHDTGMLFVFQQPQMLEFWMKNTLVPLDIVFFDAQGNFVSSATMEPCTADPCPTYKAAALASYALEVPKSYVRDNGIGTGWKIDPKAVAKISKPK